jgi:hypothetical protein
MMTQRAGGCWSRKLGWEGIYGGLDFAPPSIVMSGRRGGEAEGQTTRWTPQRAEWGSYRSHRWGVVEQAGCLLGRSAVQAQEHSVRSSGRPTGSIADCINFCLTPLFPKLNRPHPDPPYCGWEMVDVLPRCTYKTPAPCVSLQHLIIHTCIYIIYGPSQTQLQHISIAWWVSCVSIAEATRLCYSKGRFLKHLEAKSKIYKKLYAGPFIIGLTAS